MRIIECAGNVSRENYGRIRKRNIDNFDRRSVISDALLPLTTTMAKRDNQAAEKNLATSDSFHKTVSL